MSSLLSDIGNFIQKTAEQELGLITKQTSLTGNKNGLLPWDTQDSIFWQRIALDPERWDKLYPYRLLVVDVSQPTPSVHGLGMFGAAKGEAAAIKRSQGIEYLVTQTAVTGVWECVLPITPQQLKISDQFAINTSATMRGVVEEHNGVKFKMILAAGTTGIWPRKPTAGSKVATPSSIGSIFGGTIEAAQSLVAGIKSIASSFNGEHPNKTSKATPPKLSNAGEFSTGYYQALYLGQFLEQYAELKKDPQNKNLRLVFDIPKQNQSFVVTPISFELSQSEQKPNQIMYNMQFKAWKRIDLKQKTQPSVGSGFADMNANTFQRIVNTIGNVRRTLSRATNLIRAVRSDFQKPFNILRQTALAIKDLGGLGFAVADLPRQLINDYNSAITSALIAASGAFSRELSKPISTAGKDVVLKNPVLIQSTSSAQKAGNVISAVLDRQKANEGLSNEEVESGALGSEAASRLETDPLNNVFENPEENFDLFDGVSVDDLSLSSAQQLAIEDELLRVRLLTIDDYRGFRQEMVNLAHDIADNFGAGSATYSAIYGLPAPKTRPIAMTVEENEVLQSIFEAVQMYDLLTATKQYDDLKIQDPTDFVGGLANESGINFEEFTSKMLVPVPFGLTIEEIAARYMGNADKWLEIVTVNRLRSPYIDETGFTYDLLSNAEGRQFNVNDTEDNLFVGQKIAIVSDTQPQIFRKIINVENIGEGNHLVTVDGLDNLDVFTTTANARIIGYLPGTVNSQNQIYIPVNFPSDPDDRTFSVVNIPDSALNKLAKVDLLLTDNFDIAINSVGDFRLASGLTNLIQALKLKIRTQRGTLLRHLDFGVGLEHGVSIADIENGEIIKSLNAMIASDSRFESIESLTINLNGSTLSINMSVRIANGTGILPISFDVRAA